MQWGLRMKTGSVLCGHGSTFGGWCPHGAQSVSGSWCGKQLFLLPTPAAFHSLWGVFCVGLQVSSSAVSSHQVVFFTLSVLATLSYKKSQTWQLNALWPSSHLENEATAVHCGYFSSSSLTNTRTIHFYQF